MKPDRSASSGEPRDDHADPTTSIPRRRFLLGAGLGTALGVGALAACSGDGPSAGVFGPTSAAPVHVRRRFFTPTEAAQVEAATGRILPGTDADPGAIQAGVVTYIDGLLASGGYGGEPVYRMGPFVSPQDALAPDAAARFGETTDGDDGESEGGDSGDGEDAPDLGTSSFGVTRRPIGAFDRYGEQSVLTPPEVYRLGLVAMEAHAVSAYGATFLELPAAVQDQVLMDLEDDAAPTFDQPSGSDLFAVLRQHTIEGMFSDPLYGGNRDMVGWTLVGWPGSQRSYAPEELLIEGPPRPPQAMDHLPAFRPGDAGGRPEPVLPQAGSDLHRHEGTP